MKKAKTRIYRILSGMNQLKWSLTLKGVAVGLLAGLLSVLYRMGIEHGVDTSVEIYAWLKAHPLLLLPWLVLILGAGFLLNWLVGREPMASGSGIPQVKGIVLFGLKMKWKSILLVRFIGGILCSYFGLSLGREGPSIQIGAAAGQAAAERCGRHGTLEDDYLITGGAAAGLSAAFNAPLSGMVFALEEIHRSFSPLILISATAASLTADFISKYFFGLKPVLDFTDVPVLPISYYGWLLPLGFISGLIGSLLNRTLLDFQKLYAKLPAPMRPCIALLIALPCGLFLPLTLGGGRNLIRLSESTQLGIGMLLVYLIVKLLFTGASFGSGVPGGIFFPILTVGALSGSIVGYVASSAGLPTQYVSDFAVCAMAGALAASVKAPVTSILLTAEMSGSLVHLLPVAACAFLALLVSDMLKIEPIYDALLNRLMEKSDNSLPQPEQGGLIEFPVEYGSTAANHTVKEVQWPQGLLIVGLRRGTKELIPSGKTRIMPGDYLVILSSETQEQNIREQVRSLCRTAQEP
ncbi:ClC family H(+)/Cl(-) exchange transporter [Faecalispora anaeroviscerum]|uniref:ClC family H(+)/Cl(-) exchange transporter n=1 Tax=Faecalispora anaeroviscerum TaxID=2991836 RepID=UPI0024BA1765|nr:ClC family H(+)/Cl(-) exchange transporter [Faecalispora anaeroviscerum]